MKAYRVKVIERHVDYVWVEAESPEEARNKAVGVAEPGFEYTEDALVMEEREEIPEDER